jgi:hypothetical protein
LLPLLVELGDAQAHDEDMEPPLAWHLKSATLPVGHTHDWRACSQVDWAHAEVQKSTNTASPTADMLGRLKLNTISVLKKLLKGPIAAEDVYKHDMSTQRPASLDRPPGGSKGGKVGEGVALIGRKQAKEAGVMLLNALPA